MGMARPARYGRREFLARAGLLAAAPLATSFAEPVELVDRPNILLIITDDQPLRSMSEMPKTLSRLSPGLQFTNAHLAVPLCGPSRAAIMTGLYPHSQPLGGDKRGVWRNSHATKRYRNLRLGWQDIAWQLGQAGYTNGYYGKFLNNYNEVPGYIAPGYSDWISTFFNTDPVRANHNGKVKKTNKAAWEETGWMGQAAKAFIQEQQAAGTPFFCVASFQGPHAPYTISPTWRHYYDDVAFWRGSPPPNFDADNSDKPKDVQRGPLSTSEKNAITTEWRGKMGELRDVDDAVDSICSIIDFETTYVFYMTDNGYLLGEHRLTAKSEPYEESARTPFYVRGPAVRESAASNLLISGVDLAPTFYEIAGILDETLDASLDGRSLFGPMVSTSEDEATLEWRDALYITQSQNLEKDHPGWNAVKTGEYMYVERQTGETELYDMVNDPYQFSNIAGEPDEAARCGVLSARLAALKDASGEDLRAAEIL